MHKFSFGSFACRHNTQLRFIIIVGGFSIEGQGGEMSASCIPGYLRWAYTSESPAFPLLANRSSYVISRYLFTTFTIGTLLVSYILIWLRYIASQGFSGTAMSSVDWAMWNGQLHHHLVHSSSFTYTYLPGFYLDICFRGNFAWQHPF